MLNINKVLVVGLGEIGSPLLEIAGGVYSAEGVDIEDRQVQGPVDVLHICFPYDENFVAIAARYINKFHPELTIVESTVLPFTTGEIYKRTQRAICHSPVRGRLADGFKWAYFTYTKFIGPVKQEYGKMAESYYQSLGFKTYVCGSSLETEFMKILNTTYYGLMIGWFQEIHRLCKKFNINEEDILKFFRTSEEESGGKHPRPVFYPGVIAGHCVIPNALLLNDVYKSTFVEALLGSNEKRKNEVASE